MANGQIRYDLFTKIGRSNFRQGLRRRRMYNLSSVWRDTFGQIWCGVVGHRPFDSNADGSPPEIVCKRCSHYLPSQKGQL